jgi:hypothetical protein
MESLHHTCCIWNEIPDIYSAIIASRKGHLDCLKYIHEECGVIINEEYCDDKHVIYAGTDNGLRSCCFAAAADGGHLDCIKYLCEQNVPKSELACVQAAGGGHLECLKYLHENGFLWTGGSPEISAQLGHLECLKYAHENGCPPGKDMLHPGIIQPDCLQYIIENDYFSWEKYIDDKFDGIRCAIVDDLPKCLKFLCEGGEHHIDWVNCIQTACILGRYECLKYLLEKYKNKILQNIKIDIY